MVIQRIDYRDCTYNVLSQGKFKGLKQVSLQEAIQVKPRAEKRRRTEDVIRVGVIEQTEQTQQDVILDEILVSTLIMTL